MRLGQSGNLALLRRRRPGRRTRGERRAPRRLGLGVDLLDDLGAVDQLVPVKKNENAGKRFRIDFRIDNSA